MTGRKDGNWNGFYNDWDGDATDGDGKTNRTTVFSSKEDRLFYVYGDINARNCADVAYDISQINIEDDDKDKKEKPSFAIVAKLSKGSFEIINITNILSIMIIN